MRKKNKIYGVGFNDYEGCVRTNGETLKSYNVWRNMISRCYNTKNSRYIWYGLKGVKVCDEWLLFSNFKKWFDENYIDGYCLDKDIKQKGVDCKVYSPETCLFIPKSENVRERNSRCDYSFLKGNKNYLNANFPKGPEHYKSKTKEYYQTKAVRIDQFKDVCKKQRWNFDDFDKILSKEVGSKNRKKYYFIYKAEN